MDDLCDEDVSVSLFFKKKLFSLEDVFSLLLKREEWRERNVDVREKHGFISSQTHTNQGSYAPRSGIKTAT